MLNGETAISHSEPVTEFLDSFPDDIKEIKVPSYTPAEDFPQEHALLAEGIAKIWRG